MEKFVGNEFFVAAFKTEIYLLFQKSFLTNAVTEVNGNALWKLIEYTFS